MTSRHVFLAVAAVALLVGIFFYLVRADECADLIRKYESANTSYLPQSADVKARYEACKNDAL